MGWYRSGVLSLGRSGLLVLLVVVHLKRKRRRARTLKNE
jgi:hypothetical protein